MKKYCIAFVFLVAFSGLAKAQVSEYRIGITVGPNISYVRTATEGQNSFIERNGSELKFLLGAFVDIPFKENYYFHTGLNFAGRATNLTITENGFFGGNATLAAYDHEYLQIPALLKLYTNEILLDTKLFFNFGVIPEIRLNTKSNNIAAITEFQHFDLSGNFGGGLERAIGVQTSLFASLNYNIGFINQVKEQSPAISEEFIVKNNMFSLELGIKF